MGIRIGDYFEEDYKLPEEDIVLAMINMGLDIKPEKIEEWYQSHRLLKERCRKAEAFDHIADISKTSDNHLDYSDKVDSVIKNYQEEKE